MCSARIDMGRPYYGIRYVRINVKICFIFIAIQE